MAIEFKCPCGKQLRIDDKYAGKRGKCPGCGRVLVIPDVAGGAATDASAAGGADQEGVATLERTTIDYGIDLGTTNSAVAVLDGVEPRVITNVGGRSFTPSAIWIDKRGRLHVGGEARQRQESDSENCAVEFKRDMGLGEQGRRAFARSGRALLPEELSAEVIKSLTADVRAATNEEIHAAVITVPAAFDAPQTEATRKAGQLAGLAVSPLLQEPIAAALCYGFQQHADKVFWLVYDFGGGTFDAAIIQVREGVIHVVNHAGDNFLGGKNIDWDIVNRLLVPVLTRRFRLPEFQRGNARWRAAFAKLKLAAEEAKISVSRLGEPFELWVEDVCEDTSGQSVELAFELTMGQLAEIVEPYAARSINLCRRALEEKGLAGSHIERVIMVGGTSLLPMLRERVERELGAALEFSIDPITVVARGAAIFAGTQRLVPDPGAQLPVGTYRIDLEFEPVGTNLDPLVGGQVHHPEGRSLEGYTVEMVETRSEWRSGRVPLNAKGVFLTDIRAEEGRRCEYAIELRDPAGRQHATRPSRFPYTVGMAISSPPLTHSIGVAMANNQVDLFLEKGTALPAKSRRTHRTAFAVRSGHAGDLIRIPVVEGENVSRADRNRRIGDLIVPADKVRRDVPVGSEVEITIHIDESRLITARAYIPVLDEEFEEVISLGRAVVPLGELRTEVRGETQRLATARQKAGSSGDLKAQAALDRIEGERMEAQVHDLLQAADGGDPDAVVECETRLLDLRTEIDNVESALEWPTLVSEAQQVLSEARAIVYEHGEPAERSRLQALERDLQRAIDARDADPLRRQEDEIRSLGLGILTRQPSFWVGFFQYLESQAPNMRDRAQASQLIAQGQRAMSTNDLDGLRAVCRQLTGLLPPEEQEKARGFGGTTIR